MQPVIAVNAKRREKKSPFYQVLLILVGLHFPPIIRAFAGGGIGTSKAELQKLYRAIKVEPHFYDDTGFYLTLLSKDGRYGIRFEIEDGRVSSYYAGLTKAIQYVEGCE